MRWLKIVSLIGLVMILSLQVVYGVEDSNEIADYLNDLGILKGTENGYELDKDLSRVEAAIMIVRLRGGEASALSENYAHPFTDVPKWASPYVGYMYHYGLTSGKSKTNYGSRDSITTIQYVTFLLRTLGYNDAEGDFYWAESLDKAREIGIIKIDRSGSSDSRFTRGDMVLLTYSALQTKMKNSQRLLLDQFEEVTVISKTSDIGELFDDYETDSVIKRPSSYQSLLSSVEKLAYDLTTSYTFDVSNVYNLDLNKLTEDVNKNMVKLPMYSSVIKGYELNKVGSALTIQIDYNVTKSQHDQAIAKAKEIVATYIKPAMSDYEKEKILHDYLVSHVQYDTSNNLKPSVYTMYGALIEHKAVCHGYAESFRYLGYLAGLDVDLVVGEAIYNGASIGHAWNMITLDGKTYHIDTTWDDPVGNTTGEISYAYYNVTDEMLEADHTWITNNYEYCYTTTYNYFVYEGLDVFGLEGLYKYLREGFSKGEDAMTVKVIGGSVTMNDLRNILNKCDIPYDITYKVNSTTNVVTVKKAE